VRRVKLPFAGLEVEFVDRELGLRRFEEWAEKGTWAPVVVFGPEGCGKSALLRQAVELLRERGYSVALVSPLSRQEDRLVLTEELRELARDALATALSEPAARLIDAAVDLLYNAVKRNVGRRIALLLDDVFQAVGLDKAALLVKSLLNMIEYPSIKYERIVVVVATSEGVTRREIGRHRWAELRPIWNMPKEGFRALYDQIPGEKPPFEDVWRWTGGNPWILERLYKNNWNVDGILESLIKDKELESFVASLSVEEVEGLWRAVEDPDALLRREYLPLMDKLIGLNLIAHNLYPRRQVFWLDQPPAERDSELGISGYAAWQTPLHREAVKRVLERLAAR
jgi:energy-coupling factor transporter ATP-binding protein EcfA2